MVRRTRCICAGFFFKRLFRSLAAITALYLLEAGRHNQLTQAYNLASQSYNTKRPTKSTKIRPVQTQNVRYDYKQKDTEVASKRAPYENIIPSTQPMVIGKPPLCQGPDSDIETSSNCQIYCCLPGALRTGESIYKSTNKSSAIISIDKNNVINSVHSNNIERQRQRRDADDWTDQENVYDSIIGTLRE